MAKATTRFGPAEVLAVFEQKKEEADFASSNNRGPKTFGHLTLNTKHTKNFIADRTSP